MAGRVEARLTELGIILPQATAPVANYVPFVVSGSSVVVSGQIPLADGKPAYTGLLGDSVSLEDGQAAARLCGVNLIAQMNAVCEGDLDRVRRVVRLGVFVAATPAFGDHPKVANGVSDLMVEVFGDAGRHARAAVGCASLPLGVPVEVEGLFDIAP
ncbi:RidA family protein [Roseospira marina]|uniref:RidA family protein n=1 Tax=Roseospira marina TaxID=140057 RepID=A0A5M6IC96_9PROT|nr:RidA family protein [Roseospira marina]KAA5605823.1 RidA family protein [Roseospira marina]MBB4313641.1 enamine deaminase RidA (YjgF/YER057c/UK114 family) [Roseospira marina]MBB5086803.1 enamine deaminase RidA (YjgF/YER057c/UK114 family) [Roseospira marina]